MSDIWGSSRSLHVIGRDGDEGDDYGFVLVGDFDGASGNGRSAGVLAGDRIWRKSGRSGIGIIWLRPMDADLDHRLN